MDWDGYRTPSESGCTCSTCACIRLHTYVPVCIRTCLYTSACLRAHRYDARKLDAFVPLAPFMRPTCSFYVFFSRTRPILEFVRFRRFLRLPQFSTRLGENI